MNWQLPIANRELTASGGRFARCTEDSGQLTRFSIEPGNSAWPNEIAVVNHLQPELDFVSFLLGDADLCNKFSGGPRFACGPVVRRQRGTGTGNLIREHPTFHTAREFFSQVQHVKGKSFRPFFQFLGVHKLNRREKSGDGKAQIRSWKS